MAIRYAGDVFHRPLLTKEQRTDRREPISKDAYKGIPWLTMPGQKKAKAFFTEDERGIESRQPTKIERAFTNTPPRAGCFSFVYR